MATATKKVPATEATATKKATSKAKAGQFEKVRKAAILLKQASDPTRLTVLLTLAEGERNVGALCDLLTQTQPAVSHHLALCRHGGLISPRRDGKHNIYSLTDRGRALVGAVRVLIN